MGGGGNGGEVAGTLLMRVFNMKVVPVYQEEFLFDDTNSIIQVFKELQVQIPTLLVAIPTLFVPIPTLFTATDFFSSISQKNV